jgi:SpoVK/Ycf46/Vps4 family AAA+-type ATPase
VELTEGFNGADVSDNFIEKMKQLAIDRSLSSGKVAYITNDDIEETAKIVKSSVDPSDVENMAKFERGEFK